MRFSILYICMEFSVLLNDQLGINNDYQMQYFVEEDFSLPNL